MKLPILLAPLLLVTIAACSDDATAPELAQSGSPGAPFTGIRVTSPEGPFQVMEWGAPTSPNVGARPGSGGGGGGQLPEPDPSGGGPTNPWPNPASHSMQITFPVGTRSSVHVWVERVATAGAISGAPMLGATLPVATNAYVASIVGPGTVLEAGSHTVKWTFAGTAPAPAPGFHRIFVQVGDRLAWRDIIIYRTEADLPVALRDVVDGW